VADPGFDLTVGGGELDFVNGGRGENQVDIVNQRLTTHLPTSLARNIIAEGKKKIV